MADAKIERQEQILRHRVSDFLTKETHGRKPMQSVLERIHDKKWTAYLFGGVARDLLSDGLKARVRDVDVVIGDASLCDMREVMAQHITRTTRFGGLHMEHRGWLFDMWTLNDTWAFRESHVRHVDFAWLPQTTFLNVEAICIELGNGRKPRRVIHSHGFFEAFLNRTVEINLEENPYPALCIVRSLMTTWRLNFAMGPLLTRYILHHRQSIEIEELLNVQRNHYGRIFLDADLLDKWFTTIGNQYRIDKQGSVHLPGQSNQLSLWNDNPPACR